LKHTSSGKLDRRLLPVIRGLIAVLMIFCLTACVPSARALADDQAGNGVAVLVFHSLQTGVRSNSTVMSPADFELTLVRLEQSGFQFIALNQFHAFLEGKASVPPRAVLITFDDGYRDNYEYAHPILFRWDIPAVVFPVAKWFSPPPHQKPNRPHLTADEVREMLASGLWSFGCHSYDGHRMVVRGGPFLTSRYPGETLRAYRARLGKDIQLCRSEMARLGINPVDYAPPMGAINRESMAMLSKGGFKYIYVQGKRLNRPGSTVIHRVTAISPEQVVRDLQELFAEKGGR